MQKQNIFSRLLRLYRTNMVKTPLEDFTTEILAGILSADQELGDAFVNNVLNIEGKGFWFATQQFYDSVDPTHPACRVDLVIRNEEIICFVEHKVESREGYLQLERYASVLDCLSVTGNVTTHLQYCTKYFDEKDIKEHNFRQFRWGEIYRFLLPNCGGGVINEYLEFLKTHDMSDELDLTVTDLLTMQGLNPIVKKMERYLEKIRPIYCRYFIREKIKDSVNLKQIKMHSRFIFHAEHIFGEGYAELGAGFDFSEEPSLKVWIWVADKNSKRSEFKAAMTNTGFLTNDEDWLGFSAPISDFLSSDRMDEKIEAWFDRTFSTIKIWKEQHPELNWHI